MKRIAELEGLRGLLAWWVVAGHVLFSFSDDLGRASHNRAAVDVFIALSGFVIMFLLDSRKEAPGPFLLRRALRLYPAYLVVLLASALTLGITVEALQPGAFTSARADERAVFTLAAMQHLPQHILAHLTMLHGLVPSSVLPHADHAIVGPMWSISVEWQFYLIAPLVYAGLTGGWSGRFAVAALALGLYVSAPFFGLSDNAAFIGPHVPWFAAGIAGYFLWRQDRRAGLYALAAASVVAGFAFREVGALVWAGVTLLLADAPGSKIARAVLNWPPIRTLGEMSYSTYLGHMLPLYGALWLFRDSDGGPLAIAAVSGLTVAGTLGLSILMYRYVEKPGMALGSRIGSRPAVAAT